MHILRGQADFSFNLSDLVKEAQTTSRILNVFMKPKSAYTK